MALIFFFQIFVSLHACAVAVHGDPASNAKAMLDKMNLQEKVSMLHGAKNGYVGNTPEIINTKSGVKIPPLNLNDGPQGFRDGGSTAWPSGMTVGMTWDIECARAWGVAMGKEFYDKGANVQLGPGLCLARVPRNGRNFEYLSGEDPYLGQTLAKPLIEGIQSNNVIANAKHWVENSQETNRHGDTAAVDERTRFELYYPPFEGAVEGGVGSLMCSYNLIQEQGLNKTGNWSCENSATLAVDLKQRLGFNGWVMSDWGATHSTSILRGLDQEMPRGKYMGDTLLAAVQSGAVPMSAVDDSVMRILTPMYQFGIFDHYEQWTNKSAHKADVTSKEHSEVARDLSRSATVLLKNENSLLPIDVSKKPTIAVIGSTLVVAGGGSGHVTPTYTISPFQGISERYGGNTPHNATCSDLVKDTDYFTQGGSKKLKHAATVGDCCTACFNAGPQWIYFTQIPDGNCWCHKTKGTSRSRTGYTSGQTSPASNSPVTFDDGSDPKRAAALAAKSDLTVLYLGTSSHEGGDRGSLSFSDDQEALVAAVAASAGAKTAVVMMTPGAILTPWAKDVGALLSMGMPGLECGHALADVLFGDYNPTGRLSVTYPNKENEVGFTQSQYPGINAISVYTEKLEVGYRWYDAHKVEPAFPFGHGISYTSFNYSDLKASESQVMVTVTNSGKVPGAEIAQLYLAFPEAAGEPPLQLKGFSKTPRLAPGASTTVTFGLTARSLSIWDVSTHAWAKQSGKFIVHVGASSRDIRLVTVLSV